MQGFSGIRYLLREIIAIYNPEKRRLGPCFQGFLPFSDSTSYNIVDDNRYGEDQEIAVMRLFWDIYDANTTDEDFDLGINWLYNALRGAGGGSKLWNTTDLWHHMTNGINLGPTYLDELKRYGALFAMQGMGVKNLRSPADVNGWQKDTTPPTFTWNIPVSNSGGTTIKLFDRFQVAFYDENGYSLGLSGWIISPATGTWTPTVSQWQSIVKNPSGNYRTKVYWAVLCSNNFEGTTFLASYISGCYWSEDYHRINIVD